jgi:hypothetical protein
MCLYISRAENAIAKWNNPREASMMALMPYPLPDISEDPVGTQIFSGNRQQPGFLFDNY